MDFITNYHNLANAIILAAVDDWRDAVNRLKKKSNNTIAYKEKCECESFFLSAYFDKLTNIRGEDLLRKLEEEAGIG